MRVDPTPDSRLAVLLLVTSCVLDGDADLVGEEAVETGSETDDSPPAADAPLPTLLWTREIAPAHRILPLETGFLLSSPDGVARYSDEGTWLEEGHEWGTSDRPLTGAGLTLYSTTLQELLVLDVLGAWQFSVVLNLDEPVDLDLPTLLTSISPGDVWIATSRWDGCRLIFVEAHKQRWDLRFEDYVGQPQDVDQSLRCLALGSAPEGSAVLLLQSDRFSLPDYAPEPGLELWHVGRMGPGWSGSFQLLDRIEAELPPEGAALHVGRGGSASVRIGERWFHHGPDGARLWERDLGRNGPHVVDDDGDLWVADWTGGGVRLQRRAHLDGEIRWSHVEPLVQPERLGEIRDMAVDRRGDLLILVHADDPIDGIDDDFIMKVRP